MSDPPDDNGKSDNQMADQPTKAQRLETFRVTLHNTGSIEQAALAAGISTRTATRWRGLIGDNGTKQSPRDASAPIEIDSLKTTEGVLERLRQLLASGGDTAAIAAGKVLLEQFAVSGMAGEFDCPSCGRVYPDVPTWVECERLLDAKVPRPMTPAMSAWIESQRRPVEASE